MAVGRFAGIPVKEFRIAVEWYKRLLGAEPTFYPNDIEAVWNVATSGKLVHGEGSDCFAGVDIPGQDSLNCVH